MGCGGNRSTAMLSCNDYERCLRGAGSIPVYSGALSQRGYGIGGLLKGAFSSLFPIVKSTAVRGVKRAAMGLIKDRLTGVPLKQSLKTRAIDTGKNVLGDVMKEVINDGPKRKKARTTPVSRRNKKTRTKRATVNRSRDIFG